MSSPLLGLVATGNIAPSRFVKLSGSFGAAQAAADDRPIGISGEYTKRHDSTLHAESGDQVLVYGLGQVCLLEVSANVAAGQLLKSDANGAGVPVATNATPTQQWFGAVALESRSSGELCRVQVIIGNVEQ